MKKAIFWIFGAILFLNYIFDSDPPGGPDVRKPVPQTIETSLESASSKVGIAEDARLRSISQEAQSKSNTLSTNSTANLQETVFVTGSVVNLRSQPSINSTVKGKLARGTALKATGRSSGNWREVLSANKTGWMHNDFLSKTKPNTITATTNSKKRTIAAPSSREVSAAIKAIIEQSIQAYPGSCPCPYFRDRAGRRCGGRSAWSRPGGYSPLCYESDVTEARLKSYFQRTKGITY